ncbi:site-specific DNA-methyltransferase [Clostridioides difficile]|nr:site-specific DNA-methyltransferase [Clostridioides difficile]
MCGEKISQAQVKAKGLCNQIYHIDCMDLFTQIPDNFVSLILTDPPYGISYQNHFTNQPHPVLIGDTGIDYERFAEESYRILRENSHAYFFTRFDCYPYHYECLKQAGFTVKNCLVIEKGTVGGIGDLKGSYANNAEWIIFCQKGRRVFRQTHLLENRTKEGTQFHRGRELSKKYKTRFPACWFGAEYPKATYNSIWQKQHQIYHPTIKNVECLSWLIQLSTLQGELVFDGFMGTGSTALAALQTGRNYLGAEINSEYFAIAEKRIKEEKNGNTVSQSGTQKFLSGNDE